MVPPGTAKNMLCSPYNNSYYRAALALNNMATVLLQLGCFEQACSTWHDGVTLMKRAFPTQNTTMADAPPTTATTAQAQEKNAEPQEEGGQDLSSSMIRSAERILVQASQRCARAVRTAR
ncbi:hypothetical protein ACA910_008819 [Epithemia clementina (nom. ined.)]